MLLNLQGNVSNVSNVMPILCYLCVYIIYHIYILYYIHYIHGTYVNCIRHLMLAKPPSWSLPSSLPA